MRVQSGNLFLASKVCPLRKGFFEALYQLRESLDPMAAKLAARHSADLDPLIVKQLLKQGRAALKAGSLSALTSADMAFHMWLYEAADNPLLAEMLRLYWGHLRRAMMLVVGPVPDRTRVWDEHELIANAILKGDQNQAERLSLQHIHGATERVLPGLPE